MLLLNTIPSTLLRMHLSRLVTQLQCVIPLSPASVVLSLNKTAAAVCLAPDSIISAVDEVLASILYASNPQQDMKGLGYEQVHVGKLCAAFASEQARYVVCAGFHFRKFV